MTRPLKPPRRALGYHNIAPRLAADGRWRWRPYMRFAGEQVWGPAYDTQKDAFAAYKRMRKQKDRGIPRGRYCVEHAFTDTIVAMLDKGGSDHTARGYRQKFSRWGEILNPKALVSQITTADIRVFVSERRSRHGVGPSGIRDDLRLLKRVFNVAGRTGSDNPVHGIELPKPRTPPRPFFSLADVIRIEKRIRESKHRFARRDADVVLLVASTGIRRYELGRVTPADITYHDSGGGFLTVRGKGGRPRLIGFGKDLETVIRRLAADIHDSDPIVSHELVSTIMKRWRKLLDEPNLNARVLRRTWATAAAQQSPIHLVSQLMGHSQIKTTQIYLGIRMEELTGAATRMQAALRDARRPVRPKRRKKRVDGRDRGRRSGSRRRRGRGNG